MSVVLKKMKYSSRINIIMTNIYIDEDHYETLIMQKNGFIIKPFNPISATLKTNSEVFITYANKHRDGVRAILGPIYKGRSIRQLIQFQSSVYPYECDADQKELFYETRYASVCRQTPIRWILIHVVLCSV